MTDGAFDICMRVTGTSTPGDGAGAHRCTACSAPLDMHQPDPEVPHRLLACCSCEECGIWYAILVTPDRLGTYLVRLPSVVELTEAISRRRDDDCCQHLL